MFPVKTVAEFRYLRSINLYNVECSLEALSGPDGEVLAGPIPAQSGAFLSGAPHGSILGSLTFSGVSVVIESDTAS